jgi:beta-galactosidase
MFNRYSLKVFSVTLFLFLQALIVFGQKPTAIANHRTVSNLNSDWEFVKDSINKSVSPSAGHSWQSVNLPHTWNAVDVIDDTPGYYRGVGWYKKNIKTDRSWIGKQVFLHFEGANQETDVFINGKIAGRHLGGYTGFSVPVAGLLDYKPGAINTISVKVNNRYNRDIPPLTADFTFFGGLYRKVSILVVDQVHFSDAAYGSEGVHVFTPAVSQTSASMNVAGHLTNNSSSAKLLSLLHMVRDPKGKIVSSTTSVIGKIDAGVTVSFDKRLPSISKPILWSPEKPELYTVTTSIIDTKSGATFDQLNQKTGLRWFRFDAHSGFYLNGKPYKLIGASRHQDYQGLGNAVPVPLQINDVALLKSMGGNFLRVAHYPQDQSVLRACDEMGILASVEIPVVNEISETRAFESNSKKMQLEMIWQNYNHPCVIIWGYMNEILLKMKFKDDKPRQEMYLKRVRNLAMILNAVTRAADPYRYTMIANHGDIALYQSAGLTKIPMLVGWNLYQGWYGGNLSEFAVALDRIHTEMPTTPFMVTEYGADADPRIHSLSPVRFDKSVEYAVQYHQEYLNAIIKRRFVAGAAAWNLADFSSEGREETMPHINNKGLLNLDRTPKNTYFLYCAYLSRKPYLKIGSRDKELRTGTAGRDERSSKQALSVFTNFNKAELFLNGVSLGIKAVKDHEIIWNVPFKNGVNTISVVSVGTAVRMEDHAEVDFVLQPKLLNSKALPFKQISISLGDSRYFNEDAAHKVWMPDQPYHTGAWGYLGGDVYTLESTKRQSFGTDNGILNTSIDPVFQTQKIGLIEYKLDVPDGKYKLDLHFAELVGAEMKTSLAYNLADKIFSRQKENRIFNIYMNNILTIKHLNIAKQYGVGKAVTKHIIATVRNNRGITLRFEQIEGRAVLNALEVKKLN